MAGPGYTANRDSLVKDFVQTAPNHKYWIYQAQGKRLWTPEEFSAAYGTDSSNLPDDWMERYKIMNPLKVWQQQILLSMIFSKS